MPTMWETWVRSLGWEDPLEKEMANHSRTLAWKTPWTKEPGRLQSMRLQRVGHDWATSLHFHVPYNFLGSVSSFTLLCIWRILKLLTTFHFLHLCVKWFAVTSGVLGLLDKLTQNVIKRGTWLYHELLIDR